MSEDSHFRTLKVQRLGLASVFRTDVVLPTVETVTPQYTFYRDGPSTFGFLCLGVYSSSAAASEPHLITHRAAKLNACRGDILSSMNSTNKGGMA